MVPDEKSAGAAQESLRTGFVTACEQQNSPEPGISTDAEVIKEIESFDHHHFQLIPPSA
jgi:hypothetical protein